MKIDHVAVWTQQIDVLTDFYKRFFSTTTIGTHSSKDGLFSSCFLLFPEGGKLEIMQAHDVNIRPYGCRDRVTGYTHMSIFVSSREEVDRLAKSFIEADIELEKPPLLTEDGFYECAVFDPDNNIIEITAK